MFNACQLNSNCCNEESEEARESMNGKYEGKYEEHIINENSDLKKIIEGKPDLDKAVEIGQHTEREYVAITAYQPVDIVTRTVEVPFVRTIETTVPKIVYEEKIKEVPRYISKYIEKVVEVPEVKFVDKIIDVPDIQYCLKYVPKVEIQENIIKRPVFHKKFVEKIVEVPKVKEMKRFHEVETVEYVIKYIPKDYSKCTKKENETTTGLNETNNEEEDRNVEPGYVEHPNLNIRDGTRLIRNGPVLVQQENVIIEHPTTEMHTSITSSGTRENVSCFCNKNVRGNRQSNCYNLSSTCMCNERTMDELKENNNSMLHNPRIEQVFKPKIVKNIEVQKHVPISVDVPVPYMVPKPVVVNVEVPVLKFRDTFVPVPVRRKIIPKIKWISDVYQVDCIKEKPYLKIQDVIKPIPCDVDIKYRKYMEKACAVNPNELAQDDVHAMWMRVNAHLAEKKKKEYGDFYPYYKNEGENDNKMEGHESTNEEICKEEEIIYLEEDEERKFIKKDGNINNIEINENINHEEIHENINQEEIHENINNIEINENINQEEINENLSVMKENHNIYKNEINNDVPYINKDDEKENVIVEEHIFVRNKSNIEREKVDDIINVPKELRFKDDNNMIPSSYDINMSLNENEKTYLFENCDIFMNEMKEDIEKNKNNNTSNKYIEEQLTASLYPSHPLAMTYLQNKWIQTDTLRTHELYNHDFIRASVNANYNLQSGNIVMSDIMRNNEFLKSANPIISPFSPGNIRNLENYYNNLIIQNLDQQNKQSNYYQHMNNQINYDNYKNYENFENHQIKLYEQVIKEEEQNEKSNSKCCNYFCDK
ncbi:putative inner membrane complex protein 1a [Plasmodium gaboni]|uniref:Putative inner membrane complex protein 1a n=1 Tax=Plasmodium gaboni TaxID=647221 RepID=A0A151LVF5_9APIC|nr:putative inner membrane complex protein 1a [Plasmodium gaboni]KYO03159.1 putative inner membrane complex protein 1a [Plasmodium gaboni]